MRDTLIAELNELCARGTTRREAAVDASIRALRPTDSDWLTTLELERVQELQLALVPFEQVDREAAKQRVAARRAARRKG